MPSMTSKEHDFLRGLAEDPGADHRRLARECGVSGRAARRLLAQHDHDRLARVARRKRIVLVVAALAALVLVVQWLVPSEPAAMPAPRDPRVAAAEQEL